jgi:proteasome lid subunit RPN8/RPN11/predicted  nucleic acid-binding Zn-ribbon protein
MQISIERGVISGIISHALAHRKEISGLLLGSGPIGESIQVSDFVVYGAVGSEAQVEIPSDFLAKTRESFEEKKKYIIGWYHSHPQKSAFISRTDERTQGTLQQFNSRFFSLNVAYREEVSDKKVIVEMICYRLGGNGKHEFLSLNVVHEFPSEIALGELRADLERAKINLENIQGMLELPVLNAESLQHLLEFDAILTKAVTSIAHETNRLQSEILPKVEEKKRKVEEENYQVRAELERIKKVAEARIQDLKNENEKKEQECRKSQNEYVKSREENKKLRDEIRELKEHYEELIRRISKLESEKSELVKKLSDLENEEFELKLFGNKKENESLEHVPGLEKSQEGSEREFSSGKGKDV